MHNNQSNPLIQDSEQKLHHCHSLVRNQQICINTGLDNFGLEPVILRVLCLAQVFMPSYASYAVYASYASSPASLNAMDSHVVRGFQRDSYEDPLWAS